MMKIASLPSVSVFRKAILSVAFLGGAVAPAFAGLVTQTVTQSSGDWTATTIWSNSAAPTSGNDYINPSLTLRTPGTTSGTFAGNSLTIGNGTATTASLSLKAGGNSLSGSTLTGTVTGNFILNKGAINNNPDGLGNNNNSTRTSVLVGTIELKAGGGTLNTNSATSGTGITTRHMTVNSAISGTGQLTVTNTGNAAESNLTLSGTNTYTGGTTFVSGAKLNLIVNSSLGANVAGNNVSLLGNGNKLTLNINTALGNNQLLSLAATLAAGSINLNYTGTITIAGLSFDGGSTWVAPGIYSATSGTISQQAYFIGLGSLTVVPEPEHVGFAIAAGLLLITFQRTRSRRVQRAS